MTAAEFEGVLARYPELLAGLPDHADEVARIAGRIIELERNPTPAVLPPVSASDDERAAWFDRAYPPRRPS